MRCVSIILLSAILFSFSAFRIVYEFSIKKAKAEAAFTITHNPSGTLELCLNNNEYSSLNWREKGKEFSFHGQLYDIIAIHSTGDKYILQVYADKDETRWVEALNNYLKGVFSVNKNTNTNRTESFLYALQKEYPPANALKLTCHSASEELYFANCEVPVLSSFIKPVWHPPASC